jgi:YgiT-type zinc finger domain-containing protein
MTTTQSETVHVLCPSCHIGHLREERSTYTQWHEGQLVIVPNVPSQVCDYCGETSYHPVVLERLQQLLRADVKPSDNGAPAQSMMHRPSA